VESLVTTGSLEPELTPVAVGWEITMACNMRCAHCGSSCATALPGELTTAEALGLCDQLADLAVQRVTLSGGEPLLRPDWPLLAERLTKRGVRVTMISNGWLITRVAIEDARRAGVNLIAISLDGLEATHDSIRKPGAFRRVLDALSLMRSMDFPAGVITTILKRNLPELPALRDVLVAHRPRTWQLQIGRPMGSLLRYPGDWLEPRDTRAVLDFAAQVTRGTSVIVDLADCLGYYTVQNREVGARRGPDGADWVGCHAGKRAFGIRHNGDISACNSIRDGSSIEGNVRESALEQLWRRPGAFQAYRARTRESLTGVCRECQFGARCLAGCTSARRSLCGSDGEYAFCAYWQSLENLFGTIDGMTDEAALVRRADRAAELQLLDVAAHCLARAHHLDPRDPVAAARLAEVSKRLGRPRDSETR
jgi:radical SAM protein with 4Fe4S-binding SPASM domain